MSSASYMRQDMAADRPTWCPGCGDFAVLSAYFQLMEKRQVPRDENATHWKQLLKTLEQFC